MEYIYSAVFYSKIKMMEIYFLPQMLQCMIQVLFMKYNKIKEYLFLMDNYCLFSHFNFKIIQAFNKLSMFKYFNNKL